MHIYIYMYICIYIHTCIHTYVHTHIRTYTRTCKHTCIHMYTPTHPYTHTHAHARANINVHIRTTLLITGTDVSLDKQALKLAHLIHPLIRLPYVGISRHNPRVPRAKLLLLLPPPLHTLEEQPLLHVRVRVCVFLSAPIPILLLFSAVFCYFQALHQI